MPKSWDYRHLPHAQEAINEFLQFAAEWFVRHPNGAADEDVRVNVTRETRVVIAQRGVSLFTRHEHSDVLSLRFVQAILATIASYIRAVPTMYQNRIQPSAVRLERFVHENDDEVITTSILVRYFQHLSLSQTTEARSQMHLPLANAPAQRLTIRVSSQQMVQLQAFRMEQERQRGREEAPRPGNRDEEVESVVIVRRRPSAPQLATSHSRRTHRSSSAPSPSSGDNDEYYPSRSASPENSSPRSRLFIDEDDGLDSYECDSLLQEVIAGSIQDSGEAQPNTRTHSPSNHASPSPPSHQEQSAVRPRVQAFPDVRRVLACIDDLEGQLQDHDQSEVVLTSVRDGLQAMRTHLVVVYGRFLHNNILFLRHSPYPIDLAILGVPPDVRASLQRAIQDTSVVQVIPQGAVPSEGWVLAGGGSVPS
ncbi:hypothetical protein BDN72DRAFT_905084 [Pluteus cervinus]|uniref:Uncharacterized protein n=1 Tax=Pluteus cervinus TaxID=181527 RepID=A0ACD3A3X8_9AGAR|nr:hypothetical protein BDN72DRAFT_905084 [Pluteus cervinus]